MPGAGARDAPPEPFAIPMKPEYWDAAARALARRDSVLRSLIRRHPGIHLQRRSDPFTTLARAIVGHQISVQAAGAVWRRFVSAAAADSTGEFPQLAPERVTRLTVKRLRGCGLSARKAEYVRDLARHFRSGALDPQAWSALDDEPLISALTDVKGIGRWTAEMFLIFN